MMKRNDKQVTDMKKLFGDEVFVLDMTLAKAIGIEEAILLDVIVEKSFYDNWFEFKIEDLEKRTTMKSDRILNRIESLSERKLLKYKTVSDEMVSIYADTEAIEKKLDENKGEKND